MPYKNIPKIYTEEAAAKLAKAFLSMSVKTIKGSGEFEVVATTETIDRDGEIILISGWDLEHFYKNPIILWGHNYWDLNCVLGAVTEVKVEDGKMIVRGVFAATEQAQVARQLYDDGILKTVSVGFIPKERQGNIITKAELLEISFVSVPSNPDAVSTGKEAIEGMSKLTKLENMMKTTAKEEEKPKDDITIDEDKDKEPKGQTTEDEPKAAVEGQEAEEKGAKSGRVLSSKNRTLVQNAIDALSAVLTASEPEKAVVAEAAKTMVVDAQQIQKLLEKVIQNAKVVKNEKIISNNS